MLKKLYPILVGAIFIGFPFLIHFGLPYLHPIYFSVILFFLLMLRVVVNPTESRLGNVSIIAVAAIYCICIALFSSEELLRYYPVLMNLYFALLFFLSLFNQMTLIEHFVHLSGKSYPEEARSYMRTLTKIWVVLLCANALVASYSACCSSNGFWLLYNGFISYVLILGFIFGEVIFRFFYRRKYNL